MEGYVQGQQSVSPFKGQADHCTWGGQCWSAGGDGRRLRWELEQVAGFIKVMTKTKIKD